MITPFKTTHTIAMSINLQIENLTKSFGERTLFQNISLTISQGQRIGLIGVNGTGKSTLLNIIMGREDYQSGQIIRSNGLQIGYLEQDPSFAPDLTVAQACFHSDSEIAKVSLAYEQALEAHDLEQMEALTPKMDSLGAWDYQQRAKIILDQLKITNLDQPISQLSGGQLKRVALANALIIEPDLLILDEPTNHLDIEMTEWLEEWLEGRRISLIMVTHDRYFLDRVCNVIVEIDNQQLYTYKGNYSYFLEKRQQRIDTANAEAQKVGNLFRRELEWIRRTPSARTGKAKYRVDAFEELSTRRRTASQEKQVSLESKSSRIGTKIFEVENLSKSFDSKIILKDFSYKFTRGEKMGIVGNNGTGKSTFIKMLLGLVSPDSGVIDIGETVKFGYYGQQGLEFKDTDRVIDIVKAISEDIEMADGSRLSASQFLQKFLFDPKAQYDFVGKLSGGERRRLYLCTVLISNPNFLVLDEPTNDLDIQTLSILEEYLSGFSGCLMVVSHDRYFMDKIVDHLLVFKGEGAIKDFPGNYTDYRIHEKELQQTLKTQEQQKKQTTQTANSPKAENKSNSNNKKAKLSFNQKRELELLDVEIPELEIKKNELEARMSSGSMSTNELIEAGEQIALLIDQIDTKTMRWLELSEIES